MTNTRRITIILISVGVGTLFSLLLFKVKRGGGELSSQDVTTLITNLVFSLAIILGIGFFFIWNKKK